MEIVIFIGIQASGKSTFYIQRFFKSHMHINLDMVKTRKKEDIFIEACIKAKQPFVIDNTNPTKEARKKYIDICKDAGLNVIGYYFESNIKEAISRNDSRTGKEKVPPNVIAITYNKLEIPTYNEGFNKLYSVKIGDNHDFIVEELIK